MSEQIKSAAVLPFRPRVAAAAANEVTASIIAVLQDQLALAREGKLRSVAIVTVSTDGAAIGTQWSSTSSDVTSLIGKLTVLSHDLMAARN